MSMAHLQVITDRPVYTRDTATGASTTANATLPSLSTSPNLHLIITFDVLQAVGAFLLLLILLLVYTSPAIRRKPTWYMVVVAWIMISLSNLMLLGEQTPGSREPAAGVCFAQAMLIYALPPFAIACVAAFMLDAYLMLYRASKNLSTSKRYKLDNLFLHGIPILVLVAILIEVFIVGSAHPEQVIRHEESGIYCHISGPLPRKITGIFAIGGVAVIYILVALIFITFRRHARRMRATDQISMSNATAGFSLDVLVRMVVFSSLSVIVLAIALHTCLPASWTKAVSASEGAILQATLPYFAVLILGTQRDMLHAIHRCAVVTGVCLSKAGDRRSP